jgi:hypothetical protein
MCTLRVVFGAVAITAIVGAIHAREWRDSTGEFAVEAKLAEVSVSLEKPDGSCVRVPFARLSDGDKKFVLTHLWATLNKARILTENQEMNALRRIAIAMQAYEGEHGHFPSAVVTDRTGRPLYSWRVALLPYLDEKEMYERFHIDESWDSEHNRRFVDQMPAVYKSPVVDLPAGHTRFLVLRGEETVFPGGEQKLGVRDIPDGTSNTVMAVTASPDAAVPWTKPQDIAFDSKNPTQGLVKKQPGDNFIVIFCDGHGRWFSTQIAADVVKAIATRNGGERVNLHQVKDPRRPPGAQD